KYMTLAVFVLIPTWDILPGWLYFNYLCKKVGGIKVFKTVEVDKSYFQPNGQPDEKKLSSSGEFIIEHKDERSYSPIFHIAKFESVLRDKQTGEILGVDFYLSHHGGWLNASFGAQGPTTRCSEYSPYRSVWTEVLKPNSSNSEGGSEMSSLIQ